MSGPRAERPLLVGSVKTNIGHLEAASGIASVIKTVLCLQHGQVPAHLNFQSINPHIAPIESSFQIPLELTPWPAGYARRIAGVSSYGFSGTNAHIVMEQAASDPALPAKQERPAYVLSLSARDPVALQELTAKYLKHFEAEPAQSLPDVCYTANTGRATFAHRLAVTARSPDDLRGKLAGHLAGKRVSGLHHGQFNSRRTPRVAFLFTGQGSQYVGMARQLYQSELVFREALHECQDGLSPYLDQPLLEVLFPEEGAPSPLNETAYAQPALFALQYALARVWNSWGIRPAAVLGHSIGEYAAACVAGLFSLEDGLKLIARRSRLMQDLPRSGRMAAVFTDPETLAEALNHVGAEVSIAALNGPSNVIISGNSQAIETVQRSLAAKAVGWQDLNVSHAFHSALMEPMLDPFEEAARNVTFQELQIPLVSTVTGEFATLDLLGNAGYWRRQVRSPVRFADAMQTLAAEGYDTFLEIGPQPTLLGMGRACFSADDSTAARTWLSSLRKGATTGTKCSAAWPL